MNRRRGPSPRTGLWAAGFVAFLLTLAGNLWWGAQGAGAPATIKLTAREFLYQPKEVSSPPGDVLFVVKNAGAIEHNFVVEDQTQQRRAAIAIIEKGQTLATKATLQTGTYTIYCSLPGHKDAGMVATLRVR